MGTESSVKRADTTGGKDIRTVEVTAYINGVLTTVEMQVVAIADDQGNPFPLMTIKELMEEGQLEKRVHTEILLEILNAVSEDDEEYERDDFIALIEKDMS